MKRFLLFAGSEATKIGGVIGFVGDLDTALEAYVSLVDCQTPSQWWHILDAQTGKMFERRHLKINGSLSFTHSDRIVGSQAPRLTVLAKPATPTSRPDITAEMEAGIRVTVSSVTTATSLTRAPTKAAGI